MKANHLVFPIAAASLLLAIAGCQSGDVKMYEVEGRLTHKGTPIPDMAVIFYPVDADKNPQSSGTTDDEGRFVMQVGNSKGVAAGQYTVYVQDPAALHGEQTSTDPAYQAVIEKYGSLEKSTYKITVDEDLDDLELKLD